MRAYGRSIGSAAIALLAASLLLAPPASAATITVNTTADELTNDGNCSLREALRAANFDMSVDGCASGSGADTVVVPAGSYDFSAALAGTDDNGLQGDLDIRAPVTIKGAGATTTTVDAETIDRVFDVVNNVTVTISGLTIRGGKQLADLGGGVHNVGTLTLSGDVITDNSSGGGGGVYTSGPSLTVQGSTVSHNSSTNTAGGVRADGATTISGSVIADNTAEEGGGLWVNSGVTLGATQSSIVGNTGSNNDGGGVYNKGTLTLTDVKVTGNNSEFGAGIDFEDRGVHDLKGVPGQWRLFAADPG